MKNDKIGANGAAKYAKLVLQSKWLAYGQGTRMSSFSLYVWTALAALSCPVKVQKCKVGGWT